MNNRRIFWIVGIVVLVLILAYFLFFFRGGLIKKGSKSSYQAVFLSNGQVYFGQAAGLGGQFVTLKDIYYLRVQKPVQPPQEGDQSQQKNQVQLIKLGGEIHGPKDEMKINRDQILFVEDLKSDGQVVQAIDKFKRGGQK